MLLLDTDVLIDVLRGYKPALEWLAQVEYGTEHVGLPGLAVMELVQGCRNQLEVKRVQRFVRRFIAYWPTSTDCHRALDAFSRTHLSHGLSIPDALVGECAVGLQATLVTFNERHYSAVPHLHTAQPYARGAS